MAKPSPTWTPSLKEKPLADPDADFMGPVELVCLRDGGVFELRVCTFDLVDDLKFWMHCWLIFVVGFDSIALAWRAWRCLLALQGDPGVFAFGGLGGSRAWLHW